MWRRPMKKGLWGVALLLGFSACVNEPVEEELTQASAGLNQLHEVQQLQEQLRANSPTGNMSWFLLPNSNDYRRIPQDP